MKKRISVTPRTASLVIERHFRRKPSAIERIHGGLANHVFAVHINNEELVLRISERPAQLQKFMKEQWAVTAARRIKVPTPEILEVANDVIGLPYMILRKVTGSSAESLPAGPARLKVLEELGRYTAMINSIKTRDYGHIFDWSPNALSRNATWSEFLDHELRCEERLKLLAEIVPPAVVRKLERQIRRMTRWKQPPTLSHGDIRLKNVMLDGKQHIVTILDWENCTSNIAPYWELSVALHDLTIDEKEHFLAGYGLDLEHYLSLAPGIKALNILNYAREVRHALKRRDKGRLLDLRARLTGAFDLYSL